jgi:orotidine-5'-phosphate decarboxylase
MIKNDSLLCLGLDPDATQMPPGVDILDFNKAIIEATAHSVCAYKPNFAFYEALGVEGWRILQETIDFIPDDIPVIADAKRGDIGNTSRSYARAIFDELGFDAVTVNPYLGYDAVEPFLDYEDKGVFILCRTSNSGAVDFQSLKVKTDDTETMLYQFVARKAHEWNKKGNIGLVVGGTYPEELQIIRQSYPSMPLLVPGVGAQGGDLKTVLTYGASYDGTGLIINISRQILYASRGGSDYAQAAGDAASNIVRAMNYIRTAWKRNQEAD